MAHDGKFKNIQVDTLLRESGKIEAKNKITYAEEHAFDDLDLVTKRWVLDNIQGLSSLFQGYYATAGEIPTTDIPDGAWALVGTGGTFRHYDWDLEAGVWKLSGGVDSNAVHYTAETKTDPEKAQARLNIGALGGSVGLNQIAFGIAGGALGSDAGLMVDPITKSVIANEFQSKALTDTPSFSLSDTLGKSWNIGNIGVDHDFGISRVGGAGDKLLFTISRTIESGIVKSLSNRLQIGVSAQGGDNSSLYNVWVPVQITGGVNAGGLFVQPQIKSDVTGAAYVFRSGPYTEAAPFTLGSLIHFNADVSTFGAGSAVTNQYGFYARGTLTAATNNFAFRSDIAAGTGRWNLYMAGTAQNYLNGNLMIGATDGTNKLDVNGDVRVRTVINGVGNFVTLSATGVLQQRTAAEVRADIGAVGGTGVANQITYWSGTNTQAGNDSFTFDPVTKNMYTNGRIYLNGATTADRRIVFTVSDKVTPGIATFEALSFNFNVSGSPKWSINSDGVLESTGAQTIQTSAGLLTLQPLGVLDSGVNITANVNIYSTSNGTGVIRNTIPTGRLTLSGGATSSDGASFVLTGPTNSVPSQIKFRIGSFDQATLDATAFDIPLVQLQAKAGITNIALPAPPLVIGPILTFTITNGGSGYVDGTHVDVALTTDGTASYGQFDITVVGGVVTGAVLKHGGNNYRVGAEYTIANTLLGGTGSGLIITVNTVIGAELFLSKTVTGATIRLENSTSNINVGSVISQILFSHRDATAKASGDRIAIIGKVINANGGGYLEFETSNVSVSNRVLSLTVNHEGIKTLAGTALLPSIGFINDPDTGIYSAGANLIGFSTGGVSAGTLSATLGLSIASIPAATTDTDKFLVSDGGLVKFRTGDQMLSDIGAAPVGMGFVAKGVKTIATATISPGTDLFSTTQNTLTWLSSYNVVRNAVHWTTVGIVNKPSGATELTLSWLINDISFEGGTVDLPASAFPAGTPPIYSGVQVVIKATLVIKSATIVGAVMDVETVDSITNLSTKQVLCQDITISMATSFPIGIRGQFSHTGHTWTEHTTHVYIY